MDYCFNCSFVLPFEKKFKLDSPLHVTQLDSKKKIFLLKQQSRDGMETVKHAVSVCGDH